MAGRPRYYEVEPESNKISQRIAVEYKE